MDISSLLIKNNFQKTELKKTSIKSKDDMEQLEKTKDDSSNKIDVSQFLISNNKEISHRWLVIDIYDEIKQEDENKKLQIASDKLENGCELTQEELAILRKKSPLLYSVALEAIQLRKAFLEQMKNCKSKEEVNDLKFIYSQTCIKNIKMAKDAGNEFQEYRQTAFKNTIEDVYDKFVESDDYKKLPNKTKAKNK